VANKAKLFQLIDLDRTLFDTAAFSKAITEEVDKQHPGLGAELEQRVEAAYKKEETFFLLRHLRKEYGDAWFESLVASIVENVGAETFLLPGVDKRLALAETLGDRAPSWGIFTYGDAIDQHLKLRIIGLENAPIYLADTPNKAEVIATWRTPHGAFQLPESLGGALVEQLTLEDDKLRAFQNLPAGVLGVWLTSDPHARDRVFEVDGTLTHAIDLFASIDILNAHL
jgi:hypothetical protein